MHAPRVTPDAATDAELAEAADAESSLDPQTPQACEALSHLGHRMLDDMLEFLATQRDGPAWRVVPDDVGAALRAPAPHRGAGAAAAYEDFRRLVLPYRVGNVHPRFWGRVMGTGTPYGMLAEMLAAGMNSNASGLAGSPSLVEAQVVAWCRELLDFDPPSASATVPDDEAEGAGGILVSGCSTANLVALAVMRDEMARRIAGASVRTDGTAALRDATIYASAEAHNSIERAVALIGLGTSRLRRVACDGDGAMIAGALAGAVAADRSAGSMPICVVGTAGTVNTGAVDDLGALAEIARAEGLWLHVDGAFGAWAKLGSAATAETRRRLDALDRADSLAVDLHKWLSMPYGVACALVRHRRAHHATFAAQAAYLGGLSRGAESDPFKFNEWGPELSREFRALKVWLCLKAHGVAAFARAIDRNIVQARYFARRVADHPELELLAPSRPESVLNVVVFRYAGTPGAPASDAVNAEVLMRLHEQGTAVPTTGVARGLRGLRVAIVNHRSRRDDFDELLRATVALGRAVVAGG